MLLTNRLFFEQVEAMLAEGHEVQIRMKGHSMRPLLRNERDIAVLTRVGRPTCFVIEGIDTDENGQTVYRLSRAEAQRMCKAEYLDQLQPGDILP